MGGSHPRALSLASYGPSPRQTIVPPFRKAAGAGAVSLTWLGMVGGGGQKYGLLNRGSAILQEGRAPVTISYEISLPFEMQIPQLSGPPNKPETHIPRLRSQEFSVSLGGPRRAKVIFRPECSQPGG